jgi:hypothetical protein
MSAQISDTNKALAFQDAMFGSGTTRHVVAISSDSKVSARSFKPGQRAGTHERIDERQGEFNLYFPSTS